jgi:SAM-dependent methyltransferase
MSEEFAPFKNAYFDAIRDNYMAPLFDELCRGRVIHDALDVGCGNGVFGIDLKNKSGCRLSGVDGSPFGIEESRKAGYDDVRLCSDLCGQPLPFPNENFDFVLCKDVLEHLLAPLNLLKEIRRVLRPDGVLLSHVPNHFTLPGRVKFLFTNDIDTYNYFPGTPEWDFPHIRFFTRDGFMDMHKEAGYALTEDKSLFFPVRVPKLWRAPGYTQAIAALNRAFPSSFVMGYTALFGRSK